MGFKCGIVGLPNVGKSTLFNALTQAGVKAANFPFCTIKPHFGITYVPDQRLEQIAKIIQSQRILPTSVEFVDIAGLVRGASRGEGLGNRFLNSIRETDVIIHVVRCFKDDKITHVTGKVNPVEDIDIINTELSLSDLDTCERAIYRLSKKEKNRDQDIKVKLIVLEKCLSQLEHARTLRALTLNKEEKALISYLNFLTLKPIIYIANVNRNTFEINPYLNQVKNIANEENVIVVPICATLENEIARLDYEEQNKFIIELGLKEPMLNHMIRVSYKMLNLQTYFTAGVKEVRAWTIPIGTTALQAAGKIHSDFEKGFIRAQTIAFADFITYKGEQGAKAAGKMRAEGKDYIVKNGDIINFLFKV